MKPLSNHPKGRISILETVGLGLNAVESLAEFQVQRVRRANHLDSGNTNCLKGKRLRCYLVSIIQKGELNLLCGWVSVDP